MKPFFRNLAQVPLIRFLASLKITVICLILLFILTLWGTLDQVGNGLYASQEKFFFSFYFLAFGFIPFPGARLVLWVFFFNLLAVTITRFIHYRFKKIGIIIIHLGLLSYFLAAFVTFHATKETYLQLLEGKGSNLSSYYRDWELSIWKDNKSPREVVSLNAVFFKPGYTVKVDDYNFSLITNEYFINSNAYLDKDNIGKEYLNVSGIKSLKKVPNNIEPEKNMAGGMFTVNVTADDQRYLLLYGGESRATGLNINGETIYFQLRKKRHSLPLTLKLVDFRMKKYPGTDMAKSYESLVEIESNGLKREVLIYMNHPLRYKDYTFYQASYAIDELSREYSTLAVVKNPGRILPYIACFITFAGLVIHFLSAAFQTKKLK